MVLGNEHSTRSDRSYLPEHTAHAGAAAGREDHVLAVGHRPSSFPSARLGADHRAVLQVLVDHLIPVTDGAVSPTDLVVRYIDYRVATESSGRDAPLTLAELYRSGCELVESHACRVYGLRVQAMTPAERDRLVWDMLESSMDGFEHFSPAYFFHTLRRDIADAMQSVTITPN